MISYLLDTNCLLLALARDSGKVLFTFDRRLKALSKT